MSDDPTQTLDKLDAAYRARYAGHPRVTRDPDELAAMVAQLDALAPTTPEVTERLRTMRAQYASEVEQIRAARAQPYAVAAARIRTWADLAMSRYGRSFAGKDRRTRDLGLLEEIHGDLVAIRDTLSRLEGGAPQQNLGQVLQNVDRQIATCRTELDAIRQARRNGSLPEQGSRLASLANDQFALYTRLFAGKSRLSRHPRSLERIVASLEEIRRGMQALTLAGFTDPANERNRGIVDTRIRAFGDELVAVRKARQQATLAQRVGALGQAANDLFAQYREQFGGKPRSAADPEVLSALFEDLWPIAREMDEIDNDHDIETNARNLQIVTDTLVLYAREYDQIVQAKSR